MRTPHLRRSSAGLRTAAVVAGACLATTLVATGTARVQSSARADGKAATSALTPALLPLDAAPGSGQPVLSTTDEGDVVLSWVEPAEAEGRHRLRVAELSEDAPHWGPPRTVAEGSGWFVNWADVPSVVPISGTTWAAHWLEKSSAASPYAYDVRVVRSHDAGRTWSAPLTPHDDGTPTEHGFVSLFRWPSTGVTKTSDTAPGTDIGMVWLDGRATQPASGHGHGGAMTLRTARLGSDGVIRDAQVLDNRVCDCCPTAALATASSVLVAYRGRTADETRDIQVTRLDGTWSRPGPAVPDHWTIAACPVNGPALAADGSRVALAWFTAVSNQPRVQVAFSEDAGATWTAPTVVDGGKPLGRVSLAAHPRGGVVVTWIEAEAPAGASVRVRRVSPAGGAGPVRIVTRGRVDAAERLPAHRPRR